jgi:protein ImuB
MFASIHGTGNLIPLAFEFSPLVEATAVEGTAEGPAGIRTVTLDASGLDRLFGLPQDVAAAIARRMSETGIQGNVAVASNPDAAICAARGFSGISVIPRGDEAKFLGALPLSLLTPTPELQETLDRWGIRRFHHLAALPPLGIAERLGPEGLRLRELARGEFDRKLVLLQDPPTFEDQLELDYPVELLEPLAFLLARLINGLTTRLATRALATNELRLRLRLENQAVHQRTLRLPVPALDAKAFLKLMELDLAAHPPAAPVTHIRLWMAPVKPRPAQSGLFIPAAPEPVRLELTLARIKSLVGEDRVGSPELLDTHRPNAFRMTDFGRPRHTPPPVIRVKLALRIFRPPRPARVALASGQPSFVDAQGIRGRILERAGPWRTSGDWWTIDPWSRDEWDISLSDGALYRLFCDPRGWFVEGSYD